MWGEVYRASMDPKNNMKVFVWECRNCDVRARARETDPLICWNCGGKVHIVATPYVAKDSW